MFPSEQVTLGKETGHFFPWLIAILGEHSCPSEMTMPTDQVQ
jgi:hypothetical protein